MWQDERQRAILEMIAKNGRVTISEICSSFDISEMTARRDLRELDRQGSLRRVHGGQSAAWEEATNRRMPCARRRQWKQNRLSDLRQPKWYWMG